VRAARRPARGERGLTLIELMIALLVSSLLIGMVFAVYTRMSVAYRQQSVVSELQQTLVAAKAMLQKELHQAGYQLPNGFHTAVYGGGAGGADYTKTRYAVQVTNNADGSGPDLIRWYYADGSAKARVVNPTPTDPGLKLITLATANVDTAEELEVGDVVVVVTSLASADNPMKTAANNAAGIAQTAACVLQITDIAGTVISFNNTPSYNPIGNPHCTDAQNGYTLATPNTMIYRFVARGLRIDPARKDLSVLQLSTDHANENAWSDLGIGFTDLQIASRYYEGAFSPTDTNDRDLDGDPLRDWYSGESQERFDASGDRPLETNLVDGLFAISISLAMRTWEQVNLVPTARTPAFTGTDPNHNRFGDSPSVLLDGIADALRPEQYRGRHVYRWMSSLIDVRNLGVGVRGAL
jgi:prepilin-type N-terminal cleavage/methylation domain-containing protein